MSNLISLASRYAQRPLLLEPKAAASLAQRIFAVDAQAAVSPRRLDALFRLKGLTRRPQAMGDDGSGATDDTQPQPYQPFYAGEPQDYLGLGVTLVNGIAMLSIDTALAARGHGYCGTWWHGYDSIDAALKTAFADDRVKGVFLHMSSPGGVGSGGIDDVCQTLLANREGAGGKPVWVYADFCCSAAYWIGSHADRIVASRAGLIGSIGAVIIHAEYSEHLSKEGVRVTPIQFGAQKTGGNDFEPLSSEAAEDMQAMVDQAGREFVAAVTTARPVLTAQALLATEARVYTGFHDDPSRSALDLNLIDELMGEEACFAALVQHANSAMDRSPAVDPVITTAKEPIMVLRNKTRRSRSAILASMAQSQKKLEDDQDELDVLEEEEMAASDPDDMPVGRKSKKDDSQPAVDDEPVEAMDDDDTNAMDEDDPDAMDDDMPTSDKTDMEEDAEMKALAFSALPEAKGMQSFARALANRPGMTVKAARAELAAARKDLRLASRQDHGVSAGGQRKSAEDQRARMKAATDKINAKTRRKQRA